MLEILGVAATAPTPTSAASSYVVDVAPGRYVLVDAGPGAVAELVRRRNLDGLVGVVLTHLHADHSLDAMALAYRWTFPDVRPRIPLWIPAGEAARLAAFDDVFGIPTLPTMRRPLAQAFDVQEMPLDGTTHHRVGDGDFVAFPARHAVASAALRFTVPEGVVAFSSDTGPCEELVAAASGSDVFVCESTYVVADEKVVNGHGHLTAELAARTAARAGVRTLLLTHLARPEDAEAALASARAHFGGDLRIACPGLTF